MGRWFPMGPTGPGVIPVPAACQCSVLWPPGFTSSEQQLQQGNLSCGEIEAELPVHRGNVLWAAPRGAAAQPWQPQYVAKASSLIRPTS